MLSYKLTIKESLIQIQHLLKLNRTTCPIQCICTNSNTTLVKVKFKQAG